MTDSSGDKPRSHRSVSQLNKYASCSEDYRLSYVDRTNNHRPAAWLAQGTAFHIAVHEWEESGRSPQFDIGQRYAVAYDQEIAAMKSNQPDLDKWLRGPRTKTEDDISNRRTRGLEQLQSYVDYAEASDFVILDIDDFTLASEVPFEIEIGGILVKGAIDQIRRLPEGVGIVDLKTGNREAGKLQLGVYKYAVEKIFGWPVVEAAFFYAKDKKIVSLTRQELDKYDEKYLSDLFQTLEVGIQNQVFLPNPSSSCSLCPVKDYCREMGSNPKPFERKTV